MRIAFVVHQFFPEFSSGTERVTLNLARAAQRAGHQVQVLACVLGQRAGDDASDLAVHGAVQRVVEGVAVTLIPRGALPPQADSSIEVFEPLVEPLRRWFEAGQFDVVHVMHTMRMATAVAAAQLAGLPFIITLTDFYTACLRVNLIDLAGRACPGPEGGRACAIKCPAPAWSAAALQARHATAASLLAAAAARVVPSAFVAERLSEAFPEQAFTVLPHGVDVLAMAQAQSGDAPHSAPLAGRRLAYIGSIIPAKGLHVLLRALASLNKPSHQALRLVVLGGFHHDAAYERQIREQAAADPRVQLLGHQSASQVAHWIPHIDLLCLPSLVPESYSLALHECAAFGVPALVANRGAPAQAMREHGGGAVVASDSEREWARAIDGWHSDPAVAQAWRDGVRVPPRVEEEAFLYEGLYRQAAAG